MAFSEMTVQVKVLNVDMNMLIVADLDFEQVGSVEELFEITITWGADDYSSHYILELEFTKDRQTLYKSRSDVFKVPDMAGSNSGTNLELLEDRFYLLNGVDSTHINMRKGDFAPETDDIKKEILASGKAPIGSYEILARIYEADQYGEPISGTTNIEGSAHFIISNPSYVQSIAPGQPFGSSFTGSVFTEFPVFQWSGNGDDYQVAVFEKREMLESVDDIINSRPNWESERTSAFTIQYPKGGEAEPLEFGKTYYWVARMFVQTSSGEQNITSEVWTFKLEDPADQGNTQQNISKNEILSFLKDFLGANGEALADQLNDYNLKTIYYNGERIDVQALYRQLNSFRGKNIEIIDLSLSE